MAATDNRRDWEEAKKQWPIYVEDETGPSDCAEWTYIGTVDETRMGDNILGHGGTVYAATTANEPPQFAKGGVIEGPNGEDSVPTFLDRSYVVPARAWRPGHRPVCSCGDSWPCPQTTEAEIRTALIDACQMIIKRLAND